MPAQAIPITATRCPLCGTENLCAMEQERTTGLAQAACWCTTERIPPELIALLPEASKNTACICAQCVANFHARKTST